MFCFSVIFAEHGHIVGVPQAHWGSGYMWLITLLSVVTALLPDIIKRAYVDMFDPLYAKKRERLVSMRLPVGRSVAMFVVVLLSNFQLFHHFFTTLFHVGFSMRAQINPAHLFSFIIFLKISVVISIKRILENFNTSVLFC